MKQWFLETKGDAEICVCIALDQVREYTIGRRKDFDIISLNPLVSRKHGIITVTQDGKVYVRDLQSANGTYINDRQIEPLKDILLTKDDILGIGAPSHAIEPKKEIFWVRCKSFPGDNTDNTVMETETKLEKDCNIKKSLLCDNQLSLEHHVDVVPPKSEPIIEKDVINNNSSSIEQKSNNSFIQESSNMNNLREISDNIVVNNLQHNSCNLINNSDLQLDLRVSIKSEPIESNEVTSNNDLKDMQDIKLNVEYLNNLIDKRKQHCSIIEEINICSDEEQDKNYSDTKIKKEFQNNSFTQHDHDDIITLSDDDDDIFPKSQLFDNVKEEQEDGVPTTSGNISPVSDDDHNRDRNIFNIVKNEVEEFDNYNEHHNEDDEISDDDCYSWYTKLSQSQDIVSSKKKLPLRDEKEIFKLNDKDLSISDDDIGNSNEIIKNDIINTTVESSEISSHEISRNEKNVEITEQLLETTEKLPETTEKLSETTEKLSEEVSHDKSSTDNLEKTIDDIDALELIDKALASLSHKPVSFEIKDKETTVKEKEDTKKSYVKPPVIDAPYLTKGKRKASTDSKSKESKPSSSKRKKKSEDIPVASTSINTAVQSSVLHIDKSVKEELEKRNKKRRKSVDSIPKDEKIKIQEDRKKKLKEIATKVTENKNTDEKKEKCHTKPKVKQSNSRGLFLTEAEPIPSTSKVKATNLVEEEPPSKRVFKIPKRTNSNISNKPSKLSFNDLNMPQPKENTNILQKASNQNVEQNALIPNQVTNNIQRRTNNNVENHDIEINMTSITPLQATAKTKSTKKVRFKEEPEIRYIERTPGNMCRKVNTKDAPVPLMTASKPNINKDMENEIVSTILEWHPSWLEEQRKFNESPQVSRRQPLRMLTNFNSVGDYFNIVTPLMLLELWRYVFKDWIHNNSPVNLACIESIKNGPAGLYLNCYCLAERDDFKNYPKIGDLLIAEFYLADNNSKIATTKKFGYVLHVYKRRMIPQDVVHKHFIEMGPVPKLKISFTIVIKKLLLQILQEKLMRIRFVSRIIAPLRIFRPIFYLENSPLRNFILKPTIQDYKINKQIQMKSVLEDNLNAEQMLCVYGAYQICSRQEPGMFLIQGPPGTGKSFVIKNLVRQLLCETTNKKKNAQKTRILLCAPSNGAIDEITNTLLNMRGNLPKNHRFKMIRLGPPGAITNSKVRSISVPELVQKHILSQQNNNVKSNHYMSEEYNFLLQKANTIRNKMSSGGNSCNEEQKLKKVLEEMDKLKYNSNLHQDVKRLERDTEACIIKNADIICTTLSSCIGSRLEELVTEKSIEFTCCIIDEATQSGEQECLIPLTLGIGKYVLVGDPQQLPPTTISQEAKVLGHGNSLFSRIQSCFEHLQDNPIRMLTEQFRMHPEICKFPSNFFYEGKLTTSANISKNLENILDPCRLFCLNTGIDFREGEYLNKAEANLVLLLTNIILKRTKYNVGIITPYSKQKEYLVTKYKQNRKESEREEDRHNSKVVINTVDGFQGQERDVIIISSVRYKSNIFLNDVQRLNVALTRAKHGIFICAHQNLFKTDSIWQKLEADAKSRNFFYSLTEKDVTDEKYIAELILRRSMVYKTDGII